LDEPLEPGELTAVAGNLLLPADHAPHDEAHFAISAKHQSQEKRIMGVRVGDGTTDRMFRIWLSGFTGGSPSM
jgi:hypothetical protein